MVQPKNKMLISNTFAVSYAGHFYQALTHFKNVGDQRHMDSCNQYF